jgi:hypothetical protein
MTLQLDLPEDVMNELKLRAQKSGTSENELASAHIQQWLRAADDEEVLSAAHRIISQDRELLNRLAK